MKENYNDILSRIKEEPLWHDANGAPRYDKFSPDMCPNIYTHKVGLFLISCQNCQKEFLVEMHGDMFGDRSERPPSKWHYGDPPIHGCAGDTMNCDDLKVVEFWVKEDFEWKRKKEFEGTIK